MKIGIFLAGPTGPSMLTERARQAEQDGFASLWFANASAVDGMTAAAICGQATARIELGTAVVPIYTRHPAAMAQQALSTQAAVQGRFALGIGLSHKPAVEQRWGLRWDQPLAYVREYLNILDPLVQTGSVAYEGQRFRVHAELAFPGMSPCPILLAALGSRMLDLAGSVTSGTITWVTGPRTLARHIVPRISEAAERAGRPTPRIVAGLPIAVTDDVASGRATAASSFAHYGELPSYRAVLEHEGVAGAGDVALVGDEDAVGEQLQRLKDAGVTDFAASIFAVGEDRRSSVTRTWAILARLAHNMG